MGIFLPGFLFVAASRLFISRIRNSRITGTFLAGVNVGAVALMTAVTWQLGRAAVVDIATAAIGALSAIALIALRLNSAWLLGAGAFLGFATQRWLGA